MPVLALVSALDAGSDSCLAVSVTTVPGSGVVVVGGLSVLPSEGLFGAIASGDSVGEIEAEESIPGASRVAWPCTALTPGLDSGVGVSDLVGGGVTREGAA
jgi:hypothetical protein